MWVKWGENVLSEPFQLAAREGQAPFRNIY